MASLKWNTIPNPETHSSPGVIQTLWHPFLQSGRTGTQVEQGDLGVQAVGKPESSIPTLFPLNIGTVQRFSYQKGKLVILEKVK